MPEQESGTFWHDGWDELPVPFPAVEISEESSQKFEPVKAKAWEEGTSTPTTVWLLATGPSLPSGKGKEESLEEPTCCTVSPTLHKFDRLESALALAAKALDQRKVV